MKIYGTSEFENRLASFVSSDSTLSFLNTIYEIYHNLSYANKFDMMDTMKIEVYNLNKLKLITEK